MRVSLFITCFFMLGSSMAAQQEPLRVTVRGEIVRDGGGIPDGLVVELQDLSRSRPPARVPVGYDGTFEYRNAEIGDYEVRITDIRGDIIHEDFIKVREMGSRLAVRLREPVQHRPSGPGVISVQRLLHPVPFKAEEEFRRSLEASRAGDADKSVQHLKKALRLYPDYMEAHNNLGFYYMNVNQREQAAAEFRIVVTLDPASNMGQLNLGVALLGLGRYAEAEGSVRRALELAPRSIPARYTLGLVLIGQRKNIPEALESLRGAADQFPIARFFIAQILAERGAISDAIAELQQYLGSGRPEKRQEVQAWLEQMARTPKP